MVKTVRDTFKERDTIKAENETLKKQPRYAPLSADAKPEEIAEYRKAHGIPGKPDGYQIRLPEGAPQDAIDGESVKKMLALAHANNLPQATIDKLLAFEVGRVADVRASMEERNKAEIKALSDFMVKTYGTDKAAAMEKDAHKAAEYFGGKELLAEFNEKTDKGGTRLGNTPRLFVAFAKMGALMGEKGIGPNGTGTGSGGDNTGKPDPKKVYKNSILRGLM
jgi:hypothetical protein